MKATPIILLIGATVLADQATKTVALLLLSPGEILSVVPGFNVTLGFNEGASFGMMSGAMAGRPLLMAALTGGLALMFAIMAFRAESLRERTGLALIVGGALGNIIDLYWRNWHWPTFNGADIAITLGALLVFTVWLRPSKSKEPAF